MKKIITMLVMLAIVLSATAAFAAQPYEWAKESVDYCVENNILSGMGNGDLALGEFITNEQTAKMLVVAFLNDNRVTDSVNTDVNSGRWSYPYINTYNAYAKAKINSRNVATPTTREEFVASLVLLSGLKDGNVRNPKILNENFDDCGDVSEEYKTLLCIAAERGYMKGSFGRINPKSNIVRAEACALIHRVIREKGGEKLDLGVKASYTPLVGAPSVDVETAKQWARNSGAAERFIDIADTYWKYGEITGLNPAILYAQAAKETGFGKYGGNVLPEQNNWAGIKVYGATGDTTYDHESFATPDDGVRGHFNHMSAYVGLWPVGEPHGRYYSVASMPWAGTVKTLEELGGKWCPDLYYGYNILRDVLEPMINTK